MTKETFLRFASSQYYKDGGYIFTGRKRYAFKTFEIIDDYVYANVHMLIKPIRLAEIEAITKTHVKPDGRISAYPKPQTY